MPGRSADAPPREGRGQLRRSASAQRARKPTAAPGLRAGNAADGARPDPGAHLPRVGERAKRRRLPVSSSHGSARAGGERALRLPPSSFPARLTAAADRCFPGYYNNQPATARSGPLRRRPPPAPTTLRAAGAHGCRHPRAGRAR